MQVGDLFFLFGFCAVRSLLFFVCLLPTDKVQRIHLPSEFKRRYKILRFLSATLRCSAVLNF